MTQLESIRNAKESAREFISFCEQAERKILADPHGYGLRIVGTVKHQSLVLQHHLVNLRK